MASAYETQQAPAEDDELDVLFKSFDTQFHDLQQKFSDMERQLKEFRSEKTPAEEDGANSGQ